MKRKLLHLVCLGCFILGNVGAQSAPTNVGAHETQNSPPGTPSCEKCPAGHQVQDHCDQTLNQSTTCAPCDDHTFSSTTNGNRYCTRCSLGNCPKNSVEKQQCTKTRDIVCHCEEGFYRVPFDTLDPHLDCLIHSTCGPGQGEVHGAHGNHTHDRKCETCEVGKTFRFMDATEPERPVCRACSPCDDDSHVTVPCSLQNDTQCSHGNVTSAADVATTPPPDVLTTRAEDSDASDTTKVGLGVGIDGFPLAVGLIVLLVFLLYKYNKSFRERIQELWSSYTAMKTEEGANGPKPGESAV